MTLPASGAISLEDVLAELRVTNPGRGLPIGLDDADVRALAGKPSGDISLTDLYGKSSYVPLTATGHNAAASDPSSGPGTVFCSPSVTTENGNSSKTYLWSFTSNPGGFSLSNSTASACTVSYGFAHFESGSDQSTLQCVVNDGTTTVTVTGITALLSWGAA